jgi:hypothetical protein
LAGILGSRGKHTLQRPEYSFGKNSAGEKCAVFSLIFVGLHAAFFLLATMTTAQKGFVIL